MKMDDAKALFGLINDNEKAFFAQIPRCVILDKTLPAGALRLYCYLISRCCKDPITWVSQKIIAVDLGVSRKCVIENLQRLQARNLIEIKTMVNENSKHNVYLICDIAKVYPKEAKKAWPRRDFYEEGVTAALPRGVTAALPRGVTAALHKEEEPQEQETLNKNSLSQDRENLDKVPKGYEQYQPLMDDLAVLGPKVDLKLVMATMAEFYIEPHTMEKITTALRGHYAGRNESIRRPVECFKSWVMNYLNKHRAKDWLEIVSARHKQEKENPRAEF